jgi:hypothetical protein
MHLLPHEYIVSFAVRLFMLQIASSWQVSSIPHDSAFIPTHKKSVAFCPLKVDRTAVYAVLLLTSQEDRTASLRQVANFHVGELHKWTPLYNFVYVCALNSRPHVIPIVFGAPPLSLIIAVFFLPCCTFLGYSQHYAFCSIPNRLLQLIASSYIT